VTEFDSPIALFVHKRPEHARKTLEAISRNEGAGRSKLFIFSDGLPDDASEGEKKALFKVRQLIRERHWCGKIEIIESVVNKGLAQSICDGINLVLEKYERVIVLEDDLETSTGFLKYMNNALDMYQNENRVFQISGFMVKNRSWVSQTGFLRVSTSWGWATWRRAWKFYRTDARNLLREVDLRGRVEFDLDGYSFHYDELKRNVTGELNTWAVLWYASIFLNNGMCLYPRRTLVRNMGFDGTGTHCHKSKSNYFHKMPIVEQISVELGSIKENKQYLQAMQRHYRRLYQEWTGTRYRDRVLNKIHKIYL